MEQLRSLGEGSRFGIALRFGLLILASVLLATAAGATTIAVDSTLDDLDQGPNGNCTLREAIVAANGNVAVDACPAGESGPGVTDVIRLQAGTYQLSIAGGGEGQALTGDLDLTDEVSIEGAGARVTVVDAGGLDRVFEVVGATAMLAGLTVRGGSSGGATGGGILNGGDLTVARCAIVENSAGGAGGGIRNNGTIALFDSTLSGNSSADHGGGMDDHGSSELTNVTVSGNTVTGGGAGGGLYNLGGTSMALLHVTVAGNSAAAGAALHNAGTTTVTNVLLVGSCDSAVATSNGGSLESPGDSCGLDAATDQAGVADAGIAALADNGGPTDTRALVGGSPAIDAADAAPCPGHDQRGYVRPFDGDGDQEARCDSGAYELPDPQFIFGNDFETGDTTTWSAAVGS